MADFEFYTKGVGVQPAPVAPQPKETVGSVLGQAIESVGATIAGRGIGEMKRVSKEVGLEKASEAGTMEGSQLGFVPLEPKTEDDIAFNRSAMQAQKMVIQNDVRSNILGIKADVMANSNLNSINEYDGRVKGYANTLMPSISPALKPYAQNMIEYYGITHKQPIVGEVDRLNRNIIGSNVQLTYNNNLRDAQNAAFQGNNKAAYALKANTMDHLDSAFFTGNMTSTERTNKITAFDRALAFSRYTGQFNKAITDNRAKDEMADFIKTKQKDITPPEKEQLIGEFNRMLNQHKQMIVAQYGNIDNKVKDLNASILINGINPATIGQITKIKSVVDDYYSSDVDKAKKLNESIDFSIKRHNFNESFKYAPTSQIQQELIRHKDALDKAPIEGKEEKAKEFTQLQQDAVRMVRERKNNLYSITAQHPAVITATSAQRNSDQANVSMGTGNRLGNATKNSIQDRDEMMIQVQKQMGTHPSDYEIIPPIDIQNLGTIISEGDPERSVSAFQTIMAQHKNHQGVAAAQIQKAIPAAPINLLNMSLNPDTAPHRDYAFEASRNKVKDIEDTLRKSDIINMKDSVRKQVMNNYGEIMLNKNGDATKIIQDSIDQAYKLALIYKRDGIGNPEKTAVNDLLKAHTNTSSFNGRKFLIPKNTNYSTDDVVSATRAILHNIDPTKLHVPQSFHTGEITPRIQQAYFEFLKSDAYPALTIDNNRMQLLDGARQPVKIITGKQGTRDTEELAFSFKDIINPGSDLRKLIHKLPRITKEQVRDMTLKALSGPIE